MYDREPVELALLGLSEGMSAAAVARDLGLGDTTVRDGASGALPHSVTGKALDSSRRRRARKRAEEADMAKRGKAAPWAGRLFEHASRRLRRLSAAAAS